MRRFFAMYGAVGTEIRARVFALGGNRVGQWIQRRVWSRVATRPGATPAPAKPSLPHAIAPAPAALEPQP